MQGSTFWWMLLVISIGVCAAAGVAFGPDNNWDLRHYHLYLPYSVMESRGQIDHNAADIHSYLNPTLDLLLTYPLQRGLGLAGMSAVLGGLQGLNFVVLFAIAMFFLRSVAELAGRTRVMLSLLVALSGMTGAFVQAELGKTFGDLTTSVLVLGALLLCLRALQEEPDRTRVQMVAWGGLLIGVATGIKLTNATMLIGLAVAVGWHFSGREWRTVVAFYWAVAIGFVIAYGWWAWHLWQQTGNPFYPYFNRWFESPLFTSASCYDVRFKPWSIKQSFVYPLYFSWNHQTAEVKFRDFRFLAAYLLVLCLATRAAWTAVFHRRAWHLRNPTSLQFLTIFIVLSYVVWQIVFSIQRYLVGIELLLPLFILVWFLRYLGRGGLPAFLIVSVALAFTTLPAEFDGEQADARTQIMPDVLRQELRASLDGAAVVIGRPPLAYIAAELQGVNVAWFGQVHTLQDARLAVRKLASHSRFFSLSGATEPEIRSTNARLARLGLPPVARDACREFSTKLDRRALLLCHISDKPPSLDAIQAVGSLACRDLWP